MHATQAIHIGIITGNLHVQWYIVVHVDEALVLSSHTLKCVAVQLACVYTCTRVFKLTLSLCLQLYTIPPIRSGILCVEEAAKEFVILEEQEKEREVKERKSRARFASNDVSLNVRVTIHVYVRDRYIVHVP